MKGKLKCYVIMVAKNFPATHPKKGTPTNFKTKISSNQKIHTIRGNYKLWKKRIDEVSQGKAYLSVREWSGKPYSSKQTELFRFYSSDNIGIEMLQMTPRGWTVDGKEGDFTTFDITKNDGLEDQDFYDWFRGKISIGMDPMAIIHFTDFRYKTI